MEENPFKFIGPLEPGKDDLVIFRRPELDNVISGIGKGEYFAILGPRQIGKSTFLNLIWDEIKDSFHCIYIDLESLSGDERELYRKIIVQFDTVGTINGKNPASISGVDLNASFFFEQFLVKFQPLNEKKVVLLLDEIDGIPGLDFFLKSWRRIYHLRQHDKDYRKYIIVTCGSSDLVNLTIGRTSPFNIAKKIFLSDLKMEESFELINRPFIEASKIKHPLSEIEFEGSAKKELLSQLSGHPQLIQHACSLLVERAYNIGLRGSIPIISKDDIYHIVDILKIKNDSCINLINNLRSYPDLKKLVTDILSGRKRSFLPNSKYSMLGAGAITNHNNLCVMRNKLYKTIAEACLSDEDFNKYCDENESKREVAKTIDKSSHKRRRLIKAVGWASVFMVPLVAIFTFLVDVFSKVGTVGGSLIIVGVMVLWVSLVIFVMHHEEKTPKIGDTINKNE